MFNQAQPLQQTTSPFGFPQQQAQPSFPFPSLGQQQNPMQQQQPMFGQQQQAPLFGQTPQFQLGGQQPFQQNTAFPQQPLNMMQPQQPFQQQQMMNQFPLQVQSTQIMANIQQQFNDVVAKIPQIFEPLRTQRMDGQLKRKFESINGQQTLEAQQDIQLEQKNLAEEMDDYVQGIGILDQYLKEGRAAQKKGMQALKDLAKAHQQLLAANMRVVEQHHKFEIQPEYYDKILEVQQELFQEAADTVQRVIYRKTKQPVLNRENILDYKYKSLKELLTYAYLLQLKVKNIEERTANLKNKLFKRVNPEVIIPEFNSIETSKDRLAGIIEPDY